MGKMKPASLPFIPLSAACFSAWNGCGDGLLKLIPTVSFFLGKQGGYEGRLRLEKDGKVYRIERNFQNSKEFVIVDETLGREIEPTRAFMDSLLNGLSETAYINTISIGQLKSATDAGMVAELRNYIANLNTSGNMALNITKATAFLKTQRKSLESQIVPEAARSYAALFGRNTEY